MVLSLMIDGKQVTLEEYRQGLHRVPGEFVAPLVVPHEKPRNKSPSAIIHLHQQVVKTPGVNHCWVGGDVCCILFEAGHTLSVKSNANYFDAFVFRDEDQYAYDDDGVTLYDLRLHEVLELATELGRTPAHDPALNPLEGDWSLTDVLVLCSNSDVVKIDVDRTQEYSWSIKLETRAGGFIYVEHKFGLLRVRVAWDGFCSTALAQGKEGLGDLETLLGCIAPNEGQLRIFGVVVPEKSG